jgi:general secretion pathway protein L
LFIQLTDDGAAVWAVFDATGRLASPIGRGALENATEWLGGRRSAVLVPPSDVITTESALPTSSQARLRQIVPFSLEESLADDVEELTFAIGVRRASGATPVAVVARTRMEEWLAQLHAAGNVPHALYSAADGVPEIPGTVDVLLEGERINIRRSEQASCTLPRLSRCPAQSVQVPVDLPRIEPVDGGRPVDDRHLQRPSRRCADDRSGADG